MDFIMGMEADDFLALIQKAMEKREEEHQWAMWLAQYLYMTKDTFVSFDDHMKRIRQTIMPPRSADEVLKEAEEIRKRSKRKNTPQGV